MYIANLKFCLLKCLYFALGRFVYILLCQVKFKKDNCTCQLLFTCTSDERLFEYVNLFFPRSGWKKDLGGKWIKDEDAEFDSDEEPPSLP